MRSSHKQKIFIVVALITVLGLSVGFAAFSSSLKIKSKLSVNPDSSTFSVVFSSSSTSLATNDITPTIGGNNTSGVSASKASIDNSGTYPTIGNLNATLTENGQSVTYTFYARNVGQHLAYLTSIVFQNLKSGNFVECTAGSGTSEALVTQACKDIDVSVKVGSDAAVTATKLGISNHTLGINESEVVTITLSYNSNVFVDGPFDVAIGDVYLTYGTQMTSEMPILPKQICSLTDSNSNGIADVGEKISCVGENFYVMKNNGSTIVMLTEKNITSTNPETNTLNGYTKQSDDAMVLAFSDNSYYAQDGFVYNANTKLYPYVEAYERYLKNLGVTSASATLVNLEQLKQFGCITDDGSYGDVQRCPTAPSWFYSTSYWTGYSADGSNITIIGSGNYVSDRFYNDSYYGIRPVVIISIADLS